jgi:outer membrane protein assembly factor BamB
LGKLKVRILSLFKGKKSGGIIVIVIVFILIVVGAISSVREQLFCNIPNAAPAPSEQMQWSIEKSTLPAKLLWEYTASTDRGFLAASKSSVAFNQVNPCNNNDDLTALDVRSGKEIWHYPITILYSLFGYNDGFLFASCCTVVTKLDKDGNYIWKTTEFPEKAYNSNFIINDDKVYFSSGDKHILDLDTGATIKDSLNPEDLRRFDIHYAPQYGVYLRLDPDKILAFQIDGGLPAWEMREEFKANPILVDNRVITLDQSNTIKLFDIQNGKQIGEIKLAANVIPSKNGLPHQFATLAAYGKSIFILDSETSKLFAIELG